VTTQAGGRSLSVDDLLAERPLLHTDDSGPEPVDWALTNPVLRFLADRVADGDRTLETGAGLSTVLLALLGAHHTAVTSVPAEVERITAYCRRRSVPTDRLRIIVGPSQDVLPVLCTTTPGPSNGLDLVLIDGSHAFPVPFLDWYYTAGLLRVGGLLVVDDTQLWTCGVLRDFLLAEPGWEPVAELKRTAVLRKTREHVHDESWVRQPYVTARSSVWRDGRWRPFEQPPPS
jgi:predicted O-methyltransferase YrrM